MVFSLCCVYIVFEILLSYEQNKDWKKAMKDSIPQRKLVVSQAKTETIGQSNSS